jgi:hypothetical protein
VISFRSGIRLFIGALLLLTAAGAFAQPFNAWLTVSPGYPTNHGYIQLPTSSALNFSGNSFTFEAWVAASDAGGCSSLAGNGYTNSQWIGICGTTLRSYMRGSGSLLDGGTVPANDWTHVAVTFDAATRRHAHYIDGELVTERIEPAGITPAVASWRIFSDFDYPRTPNGSIDEVRFWNKARTIDEIRADITNAISSARPNLVAVYALDGNANATVGGTALNGTKNGPGGFLNGAIGTGCTTTSSQLCVGPGGRFAVRATYKTDTTSGNATVASFSTAESGIFWFFAPTNWEVIVKVLNGCGSGFANNYWVFTSALTNQHYEIEITDIHSGVTKRYFNYQGVIAPQVQDLQAFATCP